MYSVNFELTHKSKATSFNSPKDSFSDLEWAKKWAKGAAEAALMNLSNPIYIEDAVTQIKAVVTDLSTDKIVYEVTL